MSRLVSAILTVARCSIAAAWKQVKAPARNTVIRRVDEVMSREKLTAMLHKTMPQFWNTWDPWIGPQGLR
ncbi:hypothetical protein FKM82_027370 [Ascaphus truei]